MEIHETKATQMSGATMVKDEGDGIVTALVSVTGIVDNVKDIIEPGAYVDTLKARKPKGIWHHQWTDPIAKTLSAEELMPGDDRLPKQLPNGDPWPREAGGLLIKMQFNLDSDRGRRAYSDVKFYGDEQEWSVGYNVPAGHATKDTKTGIRRIKKMDLFEYSPVLFGAASQARTMQGVKAMLEDVGIDFKAFVKEMIKEVGMEPDQEEKAEDFDIDSLAGDEDFEDEGGPGAKAVDPTAVRKAISALQNLLGNLESGNGEADEPQEGADPSAQSKAVPTAYVEAKAMQFLTLSEAFDGLDIPMTKAHEGTLSAACTVFDDAVVAGHKAAMEKAGTGVMDVVDQLYDEADEYGDDAKAVALTVLTQVMADQFSGVSKLTPESKSYDVYASGAEEWKNAICESRQLGWPVLTDGGTVSRKARQAALLDSMDDDDLVDLADYLDTTSTDRGMKRYVESLLDSRREGGESGKDTKRQRTQEETDALGAKGMAFKNGNGEYSYPVETTADLDNACKAYGRAMDSDKPALKAYLMKRAKSLGAEEMLPTTWDEKTAVFSLTELKELGIELEGLDAFN